MPDEWKVDGRVIRLSVGLITELPGVDAIVYYARPDLVLGSGFGTAIATQGGPKIQEELKPQAPVAVTEVAVTGGGALPVRHILHAVGPSFQEEGSEAKLAATMEKALRKAEALGLERVAFPAMGAGFYGIPLEVCARVTLGAAAAFLKRAARLREVHFCLRDARELRAFEAHLQGMG